MASRIAGITIEIGGNTSKLQTALKGVDNQLKATQNNLKDINRLLKLDPGNVDLLTQKQKNLENAIQQTKDRLQQLKDAQSQVAQGTPEWDALQREIIETEQNLQGLERQMQQFGSVTAQQIAAAGKKVEEFGNKVSEVGNNLKPLSTAAAGLVTGMVGLGYNAVSTADDLNTLSKQTGLSTESLQKMNYAADRMDVSTETISGAVTKLKKNMAGTGEPFEKLGVAVVDSSGHMRDAESVFFDTVAALSQIPNEVERDQAAYEIFGKSADELAGIIDDGGAAFRAYGKEAEDLGLILSGQTLNNINETNDAIDKSKAQLQAAGLQLGATIATGLAPVVEKLAGFVEKLVGWMQTLTPEQTNLIATIASVVAAIAPLLIIGGKIISGIGKFMQLIPMLGTVFTFLTSPVGLVIAAIAALIAIGVLLYKHWDEIKAWAVKTWNSIKDTVVNAWNNIKTAVTTKVEEVKTTISNAWENVKTATSEAWENVKSKVEEVTTAMHDAAKERLDNIKNAFQQNGGGIRGVAAATWTAVKQFWTDGFNALNAMTGGKLGELRNKIASVFENIKATVQNAVSRLRSIMNFSWSLPHIRLPHISVSGRFSLNPPSAPHFSIAWYKKAYDNPLMFTSPTVLQTPQGLKGFGDGHGGEVVLGMNKLKELVGAAGDNITINVYASDNMNVNQLADAIQDRLIQLSRQREAAYA